ncbi:hypothetical protein RDWZM_003952 [Blomia tropicalis]|uniref:RNA polymerase-associated protein LEO1 n=1 Tax=Blomia tropicalis TaxID=40697 RepID=A0A9Q0MJ70_BLOTA|nr:hypothetical protein RDWZM_003952 [Blomia tropicalis]
MSGYENYSSDDASNDDIEFPKTPGKPKSNQIDRSDDDDDQESNKNSGSSSESGSDSDESDNHDNRIQSRKSESDDDGKKSSDSSDDDDERSSNHGKATNVVDSSDYDSDNYDRRRHLLQQQQEKRQQPSEDSSDDDEVQTNKRSKITDSSENESSDASSDKAKSSKKTASATAEDLFGELSDEDEGKSEGPDEEEEEQISFPAKRQRIEDDGEEEEEEEMSFPRRSRVEAKSDDEDDDADPRHSTNATMNDIFGEDDDDQNLHDRVMEQEDEAIPETRIDVEIPRISANLGNSIHFVKLPNFLSIETHPFDPQWYEDEIDEDEVHDDEGRARLKLKVENTIRWRNRLNDDGTVAKESNARVVKWSDGSMTLHLGEEVFEVQTLNLQHGENNHLFIRQGTGLQGQSVFHNKLTFRPFSTESSTHRKLTLSLADRSQKTQKICVLPSVGNNPEANRNERMKKEEDRLKASIRNENKKRRVKERSYRNDSANFLDFDEDDDENISISKIKNQYKRGQSLPGSRLSLSQFCRYDDEACPYLPKVMQQLKVAQFCSKIGEKVSIIKEI